MLFPTPPTSADDIRVFCHRFNEGIRVEYKATFDRNVRQNTAKMLSAFANTLGGVAIIGVNTINGVPQIPIEGFDDPGEELTLVVEQICLQGVNPPVIPRVTPIPSDVAGKCFLVLEVDESPEAPHAIENQTRVYIRTGNAANPYELATVDVIIERFTRRRELQRSRKELIERQHQRSTELLAVPEQMTVEVSVGPVYPRRALLSRDAVWDFAATQTYRGGRFIPGAVLRRTNDGAGGLNHHSDEYVDLSRFGFVFWKRNVQRKLLQPQNPESSFWRFIDVIHSVLKSLICSSRFLRVAGYRGDIQIDVALNGCSRKSMPFLSLRVADVDLDHFRSVESKVTARADSNAETLDDDLETVTLAILIQLCWSFWQPVRPFPERALQDEVSSISREMGRQ